MGLTDADRWLALIIRRSAADIAADQQATCILGSILYTRRKDEEHSDTDPPEPLGPIGASSCTDADYFRDRFYPECVRRKGCPGCMSLRSHLLSCSSY